MKIAPMEALSAAELPQGDEWQYEPKWDGFRCIASRDGDEIELWSKAGQPLGRYFPDVVEALRKLGAHRFVLDGELAIPVDGDLVFNELQLRLHPAASRVKMLSEKHPAIYLVFDFLEDERGTMLLDKPLRERRERLEKFAARYFSDAVRLSPATQSLKDARRWLRTMGGGLDGIIAKNREALYEAGERTGSMQKIKDLRTADCVVGGFRYATKGKLVGSLLLGLYGEDGLLHHVGFTSAIPAEEKRELTKKLEALREPPGFTGKAPGGPSRWSTERSGEFEPLAPKLVVEVQFDHFTGGRFRHGTKLLRWRLDKAPKQCTMSQVEHESRSPLRLIA
ncbi:MAG TPA: ATP-dependent DNA ligase [Candidatus Limnocylindrales bacterium]|nr:ATP-dependent DNA ligase [Candidatus Limnocylindrales bacterium]